MWQIVPFLLAVQAVYSNEESFAKPTRVVMTDSGAVSGKVIIVGNRSIDAFLGVPYAKPPVGELRFRKPEGVVPWNGTYQATARTPPCWQTALRFIADAPLNYSSASEDCLYLNIWKRSSTCATSGTCNEKRPVVVFIHGGAFQWGDSSLFVYDPANFVALSDVVFVTFDYRVSIFGFLSLGKPELPGNFGLWDQYLALKWVRKNIASFGGDPDEVTLIGQSAGAISVGLQASSPKQEGLFKRAVLMSSTPPSLILGFTHRGVGKFIHVTGALGCYNQSQSVDEQLNSVMSCLRKLDPSFIMRTVETLDHTNQVFAPEYGDEFFPEHPLAAKTWAKLPFKQVILGTTTDEGTLVLDNIQYSSPALKHILATDYRLAMTIAMQPVFGISISRARPIVDAYFGGPDVQHTSEGVVKIASELIGDGVFYCPVKLMADIAARQGIDTYRYLFAHRSSFSFWPEWMGVTHGDDTAYALGSLPFLKDKSRYTKALGDAGVKKLQQLDYTSKEEHFMQQIVAIISSFVTTGKPQLPASEKEWPKYSPADPVVLQLRPGNITEVKSKKDKCELWRPYLLIE
ncbi:acetylcholinesterase-like [Rhipicephalus sanguineus]|uniref:acetylcholinesterase-like n=1 Tax=Rhipicephalus sanguineus TaxID=34632 RepID=UPI00189317DF|nr:acetylcholinesterase-like [Rhipicephalus sanguineus]